MKKFFEKIPVIDQVLKGFSQVMLQEDSLTGLLIIAGIFIGGISFGIGAILANLSGTLAARFFKYGKNEINQGKYGFSPTLTGIALVFFFKVTFSLWILVILGGCVAAIFQHFFLSRNYPAYTFPFVVVTWIFIFVLRGFTEMPLSDFPAIDYEIKQYWFISSVVRGFGQIFLQSSILASLFFLAAILILNLKAGINGFAASLVGVVLAILNHQSIEGLQAGLFGYNTVLTAIALTSEKKMGGSWIALGVLITGVTDNLLIDFHIFDEVGGVLTFPFVAGTWITLGIRHLIYRGV
jgi:urea transporter